MRPLVSVDGVEVAGKWVDDDTWEGGGVEVTFQANMRFRDRVGEVAFARWLARQTNQPRPGSGNRRERRALAAKGRRR